MGSFGSFLASVSEDKKEMKSQDNLNGQAFPVFKLFNEKISLHNTVIIETRDISEDSLWGKAIWGTDKWDNKLGGDGFVLGHVDKGILGISKLGPPKGIFEIVRITHDKNQYIDDFSNYNYIDPLSTATKVGNTWELGSGDNLISCTIFRNEVNINSATVSIESDTPETLIIYLSNNGGDTWELDGMGINHIFTTIGNNLRYKIEGVGILDRIIIKYSAV